MTIDELVALVIRVLEDGEGFESIDQHVRMVKQKAFAGDVTNVTYSVALNDETRDVRFVSVISAGEIVADVFEVVPETTLETIYRRK